MDIECLKKHSGLITSELHREDFKFQLICQVCGEEFYTNNKKAKCCNSQCSGTFGILGPTKRYGEPQYTEEVICANCNNPFDIRKGTSCNHKYCSSECKLDYNLMKAQEEFVDKTIGRLYITEIIRFQEQSGRLRIYAKYMCSCGTEGQTTVDALRSRGTTSCGCYSKEVSWKGGTTPIKNYLRDKISKWKLDSMSNCDYKCVITGNKFTDLHHLYPFHCIAEETFEITGIERKQEVADYTLEELKELEDTILQLHYKYPLGVCLTHEAHVLFHTLYGYSNFTPEDFYEFQNRYKAGDFDTDD
jgi:hypothetical protein